VKPSEDPQPFPCLPNKINRVPRVAAPGDVARGSDEVLIPFDTPNADLAERFMARAIGKLFLRCGRASGFYLSKSELDSIRALAAAEGAVGT
jgi:hypothetical protein